MSNIEFLFDEKKCLAINKPGGLLTQAPPGIDSMELRIKRILRADQVDLSKKTYVGVPHRLDRPVSGIMLFGKNKGATRLLSAQFQQRTVQKVYWAVVEGELNEPSGQWTDHMRKLPDAARSEIVDDTHEQAQFAELSYDVLGIAEGLSWLRIRLGTGRTHQIRLQASSRGFPILGDHQYHSGREFGPTTDDLRARWISLHARRIEFGVPNTARRADLIAPLSSHWAPLIELFPEMQQIDF